MTNRHTGASAGSRHRRALGSGTGKLGIGGLSLAGLLLAASPSLGAAPETFTPQPARAPAAALAMNGATAPQAFTTVMPNGQKCPQQAGQPLPASPAALPSAKESPCLGALTGKLLGLAARKAGELLSVPVLVF